MQTTQSNSRRTLLPVLIALVLAAFVSPRFHFRRPQDPAAPTVPAPAATTSPASTPAPPSLEVPPTEAPALPDIAQVIRAVEADGYAFSPPAPDRDPAGPNGRHGFSAQLNRATGGLRLQSLEVAQHWYLEMEVTGGAAPSDLRVDAQTATIQRGAATEEWFHNDARGLEHGLTQFTRPQKADGAPLRFHLALNTPLTPRLEPGAKGLSFRDADDQEVLRYSGLLARDSTGRALPARMELSAEDRELALIVEDADAIYPVFIDPIFTTRTNSLAANPRVASDQYGASVSISGHLLAVGIPHAAKPESGTADTGAVAIYRFVESLQAWQLVKRVYSTGSFGDGAGSRFGEAVALDADTLVVGAPGDANGTPEAGAAYLFQRDAGGADNWGQVAKLTAPAPQNLAHFGASVALDGDLAAFGEPDRNGAAGVNDRGAVYLAARLADGAWGPVQQLTTFNSTTGDNYGYWVQVSGLRVAAGAPHGETGGTPADAGVIVIHEVEMNAAGGLVAAPAQVLFDFNPTAGDRFGTSFILEGDELVAGSPGKNTAFGNDAGSATYFVRNGANYQFAKDLYAPDGTIGDEFGATVAFSGDTIMIAAPRFNGGDISLGLINDIGAVYTFERNVGGSGAWGFVEQLLRKQEVNARFGSALAGSGEFFLAGAALDDVNAGTQDAGVVDVFSRRDTAWRVTSSPTFSGTLGEEPHNASSVAIDRGLAAYGSPNQVGSGSVRILRLNQAGEEAWNADSSLLVSPVFQTGELYGHSVALHGNWLLVGAPGYDRPDAVNTGRAYLYFRSAAGWNLHRTLEPPVLTANAEFGRSVALSDRWALIGAPGMSHGFIYDRDEGGTDNWDVSTIINGLAGGGRFGASVTVDGDLAAFGAPLRDGVSITGPVLDAGQVVVYRASIVAGNVVWSPVKTLPQPAGDGSWGLLEGHFGSSVALKNGVLVVGEPGINAGAGRARVFGINTGGLENWGHLQYLYVPNAEAGEQLGATVAIGPRKMFVGAPGRLISGVSQGAVFTYDRDKLNLPNPAPTSQLTHPRGTIGDAFGAALSIEGDQLMVGAPEALSARGYPGTGTYVIYRQQNFAWARLGDPLSTQAVSGDQLGYSVSADGEFLAAGAPSDVVSGLAGAGSVYLYRREPTIAAGWSLLKVITPTGDVQAGAHFGSAVSLRGEVLAVGAPGYDGEGAVYLYHRNAGASDNWGLAHKIADPVILAGDDFGAAVSVHEELVAVGAPGRNQGANNDAGAVFVYGRHVGGTDTWGFLDDFTSPFPLAFAYFGFAVSLNDRGIIVGAPLENDNGAASGAGYFYRLYEDFPNWIWAETILPADGAANDRFGSSVSLDGALAAFGAPGESTYAASSGAAYVFETTGDGEIWTQRARLLVAQSEPAANRANLNFGRSLELRGHQLAVGAPGIDQGAVVNAGAAFIFERNQGSADGWGLVNKLTAISPLTADQMGDAVALSHDLIVIGAPSADQGAQVDAGYLHLFNQPETSYSNWATRQFGAAALADPAQETSLWGQLADPDHDGLPNLIEAYLNSDPDLNGDPAITPRAIRAADGGIALRYRAGKETNGVVAQVKWSRDLDTWHRGEFADADDIVIEKRVLEDHVGYYVMEASVSAEQLVDEPTLYLRLEVNQP